MKQGVFFIPTTSSRHDDYDQEVDNYFDDQGRPIPTASDESAMVMPSPGLLGGGSEVGALSNALILAGKSKRTYTLYTFLTSLPEKGNYYGITVNFARRISEHGSRVFGTADELIVNIPTRLTARGIEQLFINYGRKIGKITEQINSIDPRRVDKTNRAFRQAKEFLDKNYKGQFDYLFK